GATYALLNPILSNSLNLTSRDGTLFNSPVRPTSAIKTVSFAMPFPLTEEAMLVSTAKFEACSFNFIPPVVLITTFLSYSFILALSSIIDTNVLSCSLFKHSPILDAYGVKDGDTKDSISNIIGLVPSLTTVIELPGTLLFCSLVVIKYSEGLSMEIIPLSVI